MIGLVILQVALIALNAIFAGTEIAFVSVNEARLGQLEEEGNKRAKKLKRLMQNPSGFLATIQVAITLSGFLGAAFASDSFADKLTQVLLRIGIPIPAAVLDTISVILVTLIISYFSIVFGEMVPKRIAMRNAEQFSLRMAGSVQVIAKLFAPLVWLLTKSTNVTLRILGIDPNAQEEVVTEEDLLYLAEAGHRKGILDATESAIIKNIFAFDDLTVGEICVHRKEVAVLWMEETSAEWENTIHESRHSLYPVCADSIDHVIGVLNTKDFFRLQEKRKKDILQQAVHNAYFVHENMKADALFAKMRNQKNHFAVVLDEYGGMCGVITITDLVEQLVGDFDVDEAAPDPPKLERLDSRTWKIPGICPLHEVERALGFQFDSDQYETFSGLLIGTLGEIPKDGTQQKMQLGPYTVQILEVKQHRIEKAVVRLEEHAETQEKERV